MSDEARRPTGSGEPLTIRARALPSSRHWLRARCLRQTGNTEEIHPAGVFVFIGQTPNTGFLAESGVQTDRWGFIVTGHDLLHEGDRPAGYEKRAPHYLETSVPGIFAAGDVRAGSTKQVASANGEGATAALLVREYLKTV